MSVHGLYADKSSALPAAINRYFVITAPNLPACLPACLPAVRALPACSTLDHLDFNAPDSIILTGDLSYADGYQPRW